MKVCEAIDTVDEINKAIAIQDEIIGRIERGEVLLDKSYIPHLKVATRHLWTYRDSILNTEVYVDI